jgi:ABC-type Fe3+-hydroxamate transport system substrate-binding protein
VATITDDTGIECPLPGSVRQIVSLVPSLTETVAACDRSLLIGATQWCSQPADLDVPRVRGTKNPDVAAIAALRPDVVLANKEENRRVDVERLRALGIPVWVTVIETVDDALNSLHRMVTEVLRQPIPDWLRVAAEQLRPRPALGVTVAVPIWRDPWMVIGNRTFAGDLLQRLGIGNVFGDAGERYPHVTPERIRTARPDLVLLPDEPYPFSPDDGPEVFPDLRCRLVEGRALTWYGPSLATAPETVLTSIS